VFFVGVPIEGFSFASKRDIESQSNALSIRKSFSLTRCLIFISVPWKITFFSSRNVVDSVTISEKIHTSYSSLSFLLNVVRSALICSVLPTVWVMKMNFFSSSHSFRIMDSSFNTSGKFSVDVWLSSTNTSNFFFQANITSVL